MEDKLDQVIDKIISTFKFHGVSIIKMEFTSKEGNPNFIVSISKKDMKKSLPETLDFVYWTLWTLIYGTYDKGKDHLKINLEYKEVD